MCKNWLDFPISVEGAIGGLIGDTVIICGGYDGYDGSFINNIDMNYDYDKLSAEII